MTKKESMEANSKTHPLASIKAAAAYTVYIRCIPSSCGSRLCNRVSFSFIRRKSTEYSSALNVEIVALLDFATHNATKDYNVTSKVQLFSMPKQPFGLLNNDVKQ